MAEYVLNITVIGHDKASGALQGVAGALGRIGEFAVGNLLANGIMRIGDSLRSVGADALRAVASYERLGMSLESLVAREIRASSEITKTVVVGKERVELSKKEAKELDNLTGKLKDEERDRANLAKQIEIQKMRINELTGAKNQNAVSIAAARQRLAEMEQKYAESSEKIKDYQTRVTALNMKKNELVDVTKKVVVGEMSMTEAMQKAGPQVKELLGWIQKLAIESPFKQEGVALAFRTIMAYGFTTKEAKRLTQAMIDFAAGSGASEASMRMIGLALGQIKARGKLAGQEVLQLVNAGLPVTQILAKAFSKTTTEIEEMREKGLIPADQAIEAIVRSLEHDFGGAAKRQASTFAGLVSSLEDIKEVGLREFFAGTFQAIQPYLVQFVDTLSSPETMQQIRSLGDSVGAVVGRLLNAIKEYQPTIQTLLSELGQAADGVGRAIREVWDKDIQPALRALRKWVDDNRETLTGIWNNFKTSVETSYKAARKAWDEVLKPALRQLGTWIQTNVIPVLQRLAQTFMQSAGQASRTLSDLWSRISPILQKIFNTLSGFWKEVTPKLLKAWNAIAIKVQEVWKFISKNVIEPIAKAIAAFLDRWGAQLEAMWNDIWNIIGETIQVWWDFFSGIIKIALDLIGGDIDAAGKDWNTMMKSIHQHLKNIMSAAWDYIKNLIVIALSEIWRAVDARMQGVRRTIQEAWDGIIRSLQGLAGTLYRTGQNLMQSLLNGITELITSIRDTIVAPFQQAFTAVRSLDWAGLAYTVASNMWNMLNAWAGSLREIVTRPFQNAYDAIRGFNWAGLAWEVGRRLWETLTGWTDWIFHALYDPFSSAINAIKRLLGLASPSRLMMHIGEQMRAGLEIGFAQPRLAASPVAMAGAVRTTPSVTHVNVSVSASVSSAEDVELLAYRIADIISRRGG